MSPIKKFLLATGMTCALLFAAGSVTKASADGPPSPSDEDVAAAEAAKNPPSDDAEAKPGTARYIPDWDTAPAKIDCRGNPVTPPAPDKSKK